MFSKSLIVSALVAASVLAVQSTASADVILVTGASDDPDKKLGQKVSAVFDWNANDGILTLTLQNLTPADRVQGNTHLLSGIEIAGFSTYFDFVSGESDWRLTKNVDGADSALPSDTDWGFITNGKAKGVFGNIGNGLMIISESETGSYAANTNSIAPCIYGTATFYFEYKGDNLAGFDLGLFVAGIGSDTFRFNTSYDVVPMTYTIREIKGGDIPEPASLALLGIGALGLLARRRNH